MSPTAIVLTQGSELLNGSISNRNAQYLCYQLHSKGIHVLEYRCLSDHLPTLISAFRHAALKADIVISSGGLGPTSDDITREACAQAFKSPLKQHKAALNDIVQHAQKRKRKRARPQLAPASHSTSRKPPLKPPHRPRSFVELGAYLEARPRVLKHGFGTSTRREERAWAETCPPQGERTPGLRASQIKPFSKTNRRFSGITTDPWPRNPGAEPTTQRGLASLM